MFLDITGSVVSLTELRVDDIEVLILAGARDFSFLQNYQTGLWDLPGFLFRMYRRFIPGFKAAVGCG
jgi:hypothetical protein